VAAVTKIGAWADYILVPAADLIPVPKGVEADAAETAVVNGITAWQMLHGLAHIRAGQTILVHGASGGVGGLLVQLARDAGVRVIGTTSGSKLSALRALGAEPIDYRSEDLLAQVRALAPGGVDAVFDHLGGKNLYTSWQMLAPNGTLVSYGLASLLNSEISMLRAFIPHLTRIYLWNLLPNSRHATFYNLWGGKTLRPAKFHQELREALTQVFSLLAQGRIQAQIACRIPLRRAAEAMRLAESGTISGKVVLVPDLD
jgi:NADPH:quinone reductase-like Zn-dependent oxidoreductase